MLGFIKLQDQHVYELTNYQPQTFGVGSSYLSKSVVYKRGKGSCVIDILTSTSTLERVTSPLPFATRHGYQKKWRCCPPYLNRFLLSTNGPATFSFKILPLLTIYFTILNMPDGPHRLGNVLLNDLTIMESGHF
jgi:hypothetical protein